MMRVYELKYNITILAKSLSSGCQVVELPLSSGCQVIELRLASY